MNFPLRPPPIDCVDWMTYQTRHRWRESAAWYPPGYRGIVRPADRWSETGYALRGGPMLHYDRPEDLETVNRDGFTDYEVRERDAEDVRQEWIAEREARIEAAHEEAEKARHFREHTERERKRHRKPKPKSRYKPAVVPDVEAERLQLQAAWKAEMERREVEAQRRLKEAEGEIIQLRPMRTFPKAFANSTVIGWQDGVPIGWIWVDKFNVLATIIPPPAESEGAETITTEQKDKS